MFSFRSISLVAALACATLSFAAPSANSATPALKRATQSIPDALNHAIQAIKPIANKIRQYLLFSCRSLKLNDLAETAAQAQTPDAVQLATFTGQITVVITQTTSALSGLTTGSADLLTLDGKVLGLNDVAGIVVELLDVRLLFPCF